MRWRPVSLPVEPFIGATSFLPGQAGMSVATTLGFSLCLTAISEVSSPIAVEVFLSVVCDFPFSR